MRSWHFTAEYFARVVQAEPYPGAPGYGWQPTQVWQPCGFVVHAGSEGEAWARFREWFRQEFHNKDRGPLRNERLAGPPAPLA